MQNLNPLKIGKYTFWASFIIGNIFLFFCLFSVSIKNNHLALHSAIYGFFYLPIATCINIVILLVLTIWGIVVPVKRIECFSGAIIMLINIPIAILYFAIGLFLVQNFNIH